jgi:phage baseplate assembly protein W
MTKDIVGSGWAFPPQIGPQGGLMLTSRRNELDQAFRIILMTPIGQRVMRPTFGCRIHELVFAPNNAQTAARARRYVEEALGMWEPRIIVNEVAVGPHPDQASRLLIEIKYTEKSTNDPRSLVFPFYLIPED